MILDIIVIALFALAIFIGYKYGGASTLLSCIGIFASVVVAVILGNIIATVIYDGYISQNIIEDVSNSVANAQKVAVSKIVDALPAFVKSVVNITEFQANQTFIDAINTQNNSIASSVETALRPLLVSVVTIIASLVLFIMFYLLFRLFLYKPLLAIFSAPILNKIDKLLGIITSAVGTFVMISFAAFILKLLLPVSENIPAIFAEETIYNSYIFLWFYDGNIFYILTSLL